MNDDRTARLALADAAAEMRMQESETRLKRLRDESVDAQRQLAQLFPDRAQDGTLSHAVLVAKAEVERLRGEVARQAEQITAIRALCDRADMNSGPMHTVLTLNVRKALDGTP